MQSRDHAAVARDTSRPATRGTGNLATNWLSNAAAMAPASHDGSSTSGGNIFLIWEGTTALANWQHVSLRTALHHHPNDNIFLYSNTLDQTKTIAPYREHGFHNVHVVRYDCAALTAGTVAASFGARLQSALMATAFNWTAAERYIGTRSLKTQYSDWLRTVLLYKYGGLYLDFDIVVFRNLLQYRNLIGLSTRVSMQSCITPYGLYVIKRGNLTFRSPEGRNVRCVTDCLMVMDRGHPWLRGVLQDADGVFDSCKHASNQWVQYTCLTAGLYTSVAVSLLPNASMLSTVNGTDWADLFCNMLDIGPRQRPGGSNVLWNTADPDSAIERNVSRACYTWHRLSSGGASSLRLSARSGTLGGQLLARHMSWPMAMRTPRRAREHDAEPALGTLHDYSRWDGMTCQAAGRGPRSDAPAAVMCTLPVSKS